MIEPINLDLPSYKIFGFLRVSPMNWRRWQIFKQNRLALGSAIILLLIAMLALPAEMLANTKPIFIWYDGQPFFPLFQTYLEIDFGGFLPIQADYRSEELRALITDNGWILDPFLIPYSYDTPLDAADGVPFAPYPPSWEHPFGVDAKARDVMARVIYGLRVSLAFGFILTIVTTFTSIIAGAISGYYGGWTDLIFQRVLEIYSSIPTLYVLIILASIRTPGFWMLLLLFIVFSWYGGMGVVRIEFFRARNLDYVRAARALGLREPTIIFKHVLPNALVATMTFLPFSLAGSVTALSSLDYLGFGLPPTSASLGELSLQARQNLDAYWLAFTSFGVLGGLLLLLIFVGEGIRDAFDPRKQLR